MSKLFRGFDTFSDHAQPEVGGKTDDRFGDCSLGASVGQFGDKASVDLDRGEREIAKMGQRRVSSPEVIERQQEAFLVKRFERGEAFRSSIKC